MNIYLLILTACAVLIVLLLALLTFRIWRVLSEMEFILRETRDEASPALRKLNRILEDVEKVSDRVDRQSSNVNKLLDGVRDDLDDIRLDWKHLIRSWSRRLSPGKSSASLSTIALVVFEVVKAYFDFRSRKVAPNNQSTPEKEDES